MIVLYIYDISYVVHVLTTLEDYRPPIQIDVVYYIIYTLYKCSVHTSAVHTDTKAATRTCHWNNGAWLTSYKSEESCSPADMPDTLPGIHSLQESVFSLHVFWYIHDIKTIRDKLCWGWQEDHRGIIMACVCLCVSSKQSLPLPNT